MKKTIVTSMLVSSGILLSSHSAYADSVENSGESSSGPNSAEIEQNVDSPQSVNTVRPSAQQKSQNVAMQPKSSIDTKVQNGNNVSTETEAHDGATEETPHNDAHVNPQTETVSPQVEHDTHEHVGHAHDGHHHEEIHQHHPIEEEREAHPEQEKVQNIGPVDHITRNEKDLKDNKQVVDPNNFSAISFELYDPFKSNAQLIMPEGQKTSSFGYYVLKQTNWKDIPFQLPQVSIPEGYYLKYWSYDLPKEGQVTRDRAFRAHIGIEKYRNTPPVIGPFTNATSVEVTERLKQVDRDDYAPVFFKALNNGHFIVGSQVSNNIVYYLKHGQTWQQLKESGLIIPTPVANDDNTEFIEWRNALPQDNEYPTVNFYLGAFGTKDLLIGSYVPSDVNHPLDDNDPARPHPRDITRSYDKNHYTPIAFVADGPGYLDDFTSVEKALVYLVRNNPTWKDSAFGAPTPIPDEGSVFVGWDSPISDSGDNKVERKVFKAIFKSKEELAAKDWDTPNAQEGKATEDAHAEAWEKEAETKDWDTPNAQEGKATEDAHAEAWEKEAEKHQADFPNENHQNQSDMSSHDKQAMDQKSSSNAISKDKMQSQQVAHEKNMDQPQTEHKSMQSTVQAQMMNTRPSKTQNVNMMSSAGSHDDAQYPSPSILNAVPSEPHGVNIMTTEMQTVKQSHLTDNLHKNDMVTASQQHEEKMLPETGQNGRSFLMLLSLLFTSMGAFILRKTK
ncbi:LPXTG cell wall anchor domain-containing protein [Staphylococcus coagulans]|uniref:LPXTG cell wall anchor domain-containing protein n=1 Tax=Staphylococcus coagulans TaxID=74706 RepID=UPI0030EE3083